MKKVAFVTTTSTNAAKGADVLRRAGIKNEMIKIHGGTASGCLYGIVVDQDSYGITKSVLIKANVRVIMEREYPL